MCLFSKLIESKQTTGNKMILWTLAVIRLNLGIISCNVRKYIGVFPYNINAYTQLLIKLAIRLIIKVLFDVCVFVLCFHPPTRLSVSAK